MRSKLSSSSRYRLEKHRAANTTDSQRIQLLLRGAGALLPEQINELIAHGARIRARAGTVVTIDVALDAVERVLDLEFVLTAELASPLHPEAGGNG